MRDECIHIKVLENICTFLQKESLSIKGLSYSPIKGPEGNVEFLLHISNDGKNAVLPEQSILETVRQAHEILC